MKFSLRLLTERIHKAGAHPFKFGFVFVLIVFSLVSPGGIEDSRMGYAIHQGILESLEVDEEGSALELLTGSTVGVSDPPTKEEVESFEIFLHNTQEYFMKYGLIFGGVLLLVFIIIILVVNVRKNRAPRYAPTTDFTPKNIELHTSHKKLWRAKLKGKSQDLLPEKKRALHLEILRSRSSRPQTIHLKKRDERVALERRMNTLIAKVQDYKKPRTKELSPPKNIEKLNAELSLVERQLANLDGVRLKKQGSVISSLPRREDSKDVGRLPIAHDAPLSLIKEIKRTFSRKPENPEDLKAQQEVERIAARIGTPVTDDELTALEKEIAEIGNSMPSQRRIRIISSLASDKGEVVQKKSNENFTKGKERLQKGNNKNSAQSQRTELEMIEEELKKL